MKYIDIHCHLDFPDYEEDYSEVIRRMKEGNVNAITIGTDFKSSKKAVEIAEENENVWACIGVHPNHTTSSPALPLAMGKGAPSPSQGEGWGEVENEFEKLVQSEKVVAIGECGLDYFRLKDESDKERQKELFEQQIDFAMKQNKPLMLHCRNAYDEVIEILRSHPGVRGNCHFYAGNIDQAKKFLELGFTFSFTGVITFTGDYDEVIRFLPLDSIMSETDAPFVSPVPYRGKRNEPAYVIEVVKKMAQIKAISEEQMAESIVENAKRVFGVVV